MQLKEFLAEKLTPDDLSQYEKVLNEVYKKKIAMSNQLFSAKNDLLQDKISKEEYQKLKAQEKIVNTEYKKVLKNRAFKINYQNAQKMLRSSHGENLDYLDISNEVEQAKKLYHNFKKIVSDRGKTAKVAKLNDWAVEVEDLTFKYGVDFPEVLKDVSFKIKHGEYVAIIGHNGSGKSTLSKILIGVLHNLQGQIKMFGNTMNKDNIGQMRQFLGIVFQNPDNQFIGSTVRADIAFGLENKRVDPKDMPMIIKKSAKMVGMSEFLDHEPLNLSGGQKQRVAIASAIALNPDILIFDEATSMLDPKGKREIKEIMVNLRNQGDKTILSITHDMDEILNADKVLVMNKGKVVKFGPPLEIIGDGAFLSSIHLGIPFVSQVAQELIKAGVKVDQTTKMDELVEQLWKK